MQHASMGPGVLRWLARGLSLLIVVLLVTTILAAGSNPIGIIRSTHGLFLLFPMGVCLGMLLAWRWELLGSLLSFASLASFYIAHMIRSGRWPGGPFFALFTLPALLFLLAWLWQYKPRTLHPQPPA